MKKLIFVLLLIAACCIIASCALTTTVPYAADGKPWFSDDPDKNGIFWFGMSIEEAAQAFEENGLVTRTFPIYEYDEFGSREVAGDGEQRYISSAGSELHGLTFIDGELTSFLIMPQPHLNDQDLSIDINLLTEKGLGIGDSFDKVEELYGEPFRVDNEDDRGSVVYHYKLGDNYFLIILANGVPDVVDAINYHINESIEW